MNCKQYWNKTFGESSIHGFPYLVRRELHWLEKVFWALVIILAAYFSIGICLNQWKRFRENPIVYSLELAWDKSNPFVGITLCSKSTNQDDMDHVIEDIWGVTKSTNNTKYQYYVEFLGILSSLSYLRLNKLRPYEEDLSLNDIKFGEILLALNHKILPQKRYATIDDSDENHVDLGEKDDYAAAMTEVGICRTTSQLNRYTNPFGDLKSLKVSDVRYCNIMYECNTKIFPKEGAETNLSIFLHNVEDIVAPNSQGTIMRQSTTHGSLTIELLLSLTTAETGVRNLPINYRKCRYKDENNLKYFQIYRPGLCRIECRINAAMQKCGCKPYFYVVAPHIPVCNIKGMLCLADKNWPTEIQCNCPDLCEEEKYIGLQTTVQKDETTKFENTAIVKLYLQRMAMKRRVVFSTDQLIMSFGGAIGLFLGASFISLYGLLYTLSEYVFKNMFACLNNKRSLKRKQLKAKQRITLVREVY